MQSNTLGALKVWSSTSAVLTAVLQKCLS